LESTVSTGHWCSRSTRAATANTAALAAQGAINLNPSFALGHLVSSTSGRIFDALMGSMFDDESAVMRK
jgi:hypothetical protein